MKVNVILLEINAGILLINVGCGADGRRINKFSIIGIPKTFKNNFNQ